MAHDPYASLADRRTPADPQIGEAGIYFPHSNGAHYDWTGIPYDCTVAAIHADGFVDVDVPELGLIEHVYWGQLGPGAMRGDMPYVLDPEPTD